MENPVAVGTAVGVVLTVGLAKLAILAIEILSSCLKACLERGLIRESHGVVEVLLGDERSQAHVFSHDLVMVSA